jgi:exosome complex component RRP42
MSNIVSRLKRKKIEEILQTGKRMDGRNLEDYRTLEIKKGFLEKVEGSAEVKLGKTHLVVGVKADIGTPFEDTPDQGVLMVNAEFTPLAHSTWEPGPPPEAAVELARVVDRGLRSAEIINLEELGLLSGKKVYLIFVDLFILNYDGNLIDACSAGALAALKRAEIQEFKVTKGELKKTEKKKKLELESLPIAVTYVKIGDHFIMDPTADEEEVMDGRLTVTIDQNGNVTTLQKAGVSSFSMEEIEKCINSAGEKAAKIRTLAVGNE